VDTFDDVVDPGDGLTSLREAFSQAAGTLAEADTIRLPRAIGSAVGFYRLTLGEIGVNDSTGKVTIQGDVGPSTVFAAPGSRLFTVSADSAVEFNQVGMTGGVADFGGAIRNWGDLTLRGSALYNNSAAWGGAIANGGTLTLISTGIDNNASNEHGGGIFSNGELNISGGSITGNSAGPGVGGGIDNDYGELTIINCYIASNTAATGGGIRTSTPTSIADTTFSGNSAESGGGIEIGVNGAVTLSYVTFTGNSALVRGGGVDNFGGALTARDSDFGANSADQGGALSNYYTGTMTLERCAVHDNVATSTGGGVTHSGASLEIIDSALTDNSAVEGGAVYLQGDLRVAGSTLSGNSARDGGGIYNLSAMASITDCVFQENTGDSGGALYNYFGTATITDSELSDNTAMYGGGGIINLFGLVEITRGALTSNVTLFGSAGFMLNYGTAVLTSSTLTGSSAPDNGGAFFNFGSDAAHPASLSITDSLLAGNSAYQGGVIFNHSATLTIEGSTFEDNQAGYAGGVLMNLSGVDGQSGQVAITESTLAANSAVVTGGAIQNGSLSILTLDRVALTANAAESGGALSNRGSVAITASTIGGNTATNLGGGIDNDEDAVLSIAGSTVRDNAATQGGGISCGYSGTITITASTIVGNTAADGGGGLRNLGSAVSIESGTLARNGANFAGGILNFGAPMLIRNTIVAGNSTATTVPDAYGSFTSQGYNLVGVGAGATGFTAAGDRVGGAASPIDPLLGPLQDNGGPTFTLALLPGSPALDGGDVSLGGTHDQRGVARPQGGRIDIGAFESSIQTDTTAEKPILDVADASGPENGPIALNIDAALVDTDGSEFLVIIIGGLPTGAALSAGTDVGGGQWMLTPAQLSGLTIVAPGSTLPGASLLLTVTAIATESASGDIATTAATLLVTVLNIAPTATLVGPSSGLVGQDRSFTLSASDPSPADQAAGFSYAIDWGDGSPVQAIGPAIGSLMVSHAFLTIGSHAVRVHAIDQDGSAGPDSQSIVSISDITPASLQDAVDEAIMTGGEVTLLPASDTQVSAAIAAINTVQPPGAGTPVQVTLDLGGGVYHTETAIATQAGVTLVIMNGTLVGGSPALEVNGGLVILQNVVATNSTNAPTILVHGGTLIVRDSVIHESDRFDKAAIRITGGSVDLGSTTDPGRNTFIVHGAGVLIRNVASASIPAVGNTFQVDGSTLANGGAIEDLIVHALDDATYGLVDFDPGRVYVTASSSSVQRGVDAVAVGGTVFVADGASDHRFSIGEKALTVAFADGSSIGLKADPLAPGAQALFITGTSGDDTIKVKTGDAPGDVEIRINGPPKATVHPTGRIVVYGGLGDDDIKVQEDVNAPAWLFGGAGDDKLRGGSGVNVLVGGAGDDVLSGGSSRDLLIGGAGADKITGEAADDILVAGFTLFDLNEQALGSILAEWTSSRSYSSRIRNLKGDASNPDFASRSNGAIYLSVTGNAEGRTPTVFDDGDQDTLTGSEGSDWFLLNLDGDGDKKKKDKITELTGSELASDLDFINGT